nr:MAG TPA: hypothetical protein [Caudoviricetes sp.]
MQNLYYNYGKHQLPKRNSSFRYSKKNEDVRL